MIEVATAINSFWPSPQADFVQPSEQLITLTYSQLQDLVTKAVDATTQPLLERLENLEATVASQNEKIAALESTQEQDVSRLALDIAYDRQRLTKLEKIEPQPLQRDRADILRALLAANGGKMLAKEARQKMHLGKEQFSLLISKMDEYIETKPLHSDNRKKILVLRTS